MTMSAQSHANLSSFHDVTVSFSGTTSSGQASIHYITAGAPTSPTILCLHGFPSSSHQYKEFIPLLAESYHVVAPDMPGFGLTTVPEDFHYTFDNLAAVMAAWLTEINLASYAMYVFDYGAPVGLRLAIEHPCRTKAIISQNGNAYKQGFGEDFWKPIFNLWNSSNADAERKFLVENVLTLATTKFQYTQGTPDSDLSLLDPQSWHLDFLQNIAGAANQEHQLDLFYDYRMNVEMYPVFQKYFRESKVPILAVWGKGDPAFIPSGAEAFRQDSPSTIVKFVDAGHFALQTKRWEIAAIVKEWLNDIGY